MLTRHIGCQIDLGNIKRGMPGAVVLSLRADSGAQALFLVASATLTSLEVGPSRILV